MIENIKEFFRNIVSKIDDFKLSKMENEKYRLFKRIEKQQELLKKLNTKIFNLENTLKDKDKIIKLLEKESWRLMGFDDEDFKKVSKEFPGKEGKKNTILYHQAGNSIVVNVLEAIFKELLPIVEKER